MNWRCSAFASLLSVACLAPVSGAPAPQPVRLAVDRKGILRVPAVALKKLKVAPASDGTVCVEFPVSMRAKRKDPEDHSFDPTLPPRIWVPLRRDGSLEVRKTRLAPDLVYVPGGPGTRFTARGVQGRLVLQKAAR